MPGYQAGLAAVPRSSWRSSHCATKLASCSAASSKPKLSIADRLLWVWISTVWQDWKSGALIIKPAILSDRTASGPSPLVVRRGACRLLAISAAFEVRLLGSILTSGVLRSFHDMLLLVQPACQPSISPRTPCYGAAAVR